MGLHFLHLFLYVSDAVSVGVEHIGAEVGFVQRRKEVLRHQSHYNEREDEQDDHASQCQRFPAYQYAEDRCKLMVEGLVVRIFTVVACLGFQYEIAECRGLRQCQYPA